MHSLAREWMCAETNLGIREPCSYPKKTFNEFQLIQNATAGVLTRTRRTKEHQASSYLSTRPEYTSDM